MNYLVAVDDCFLDAPGGMGRVAWDIGMQMRDAGHRVAMLCTRRGKAADASELSEAEGVTIARYSRPVLPFWHPGRIGRVAAEGAAVARRNLSTCRWDVIHIHAPFTGAAARRAFGAGPRYVYTVHSPTVQELQVNWRNEGWRGRVKLALGQGSLLRLEGGLLRQCQAIHTLSRYTRDQLESLYGIGDRVTIVPHWRRPELKRAHTQAEARRLLGWPADERILFTLRQFKPRNGIDLAIRAIGPLAKRGKCWFMIGGDGSLRPAFEQLARDLGVAERVRFLGRISDEALGLAYQAADLFVLPTLALECFGLIILEAFAFGCPVLSTDAGAIPETVRPVMPGFIVPAGNVDALRERVEAYLSGGLQTPAAEELIRYTKERFDRSVIVPQLMALMEPGACVSS